jgi:signal transduction histidine kinase
LKVKCFQKEDALKRKREHGMKRVLHTLEIIFYAVFALGFIGLLFYFLGVQPMRGVANQINIWICICLVSGGMLAMAVYNLSLRFFARREKAALCFAVFCIGQTFRFFFMPGSIGWQLFPGLPEQFIILVLRQIPYAISLAGLILFVYEIFGEGRSAKLKYVLIAVTTTMSFAITAFGFDHSIWRAVLGLPLVVIYSAACIAVIVKSPEYRRNRLSVLYLLGFILYAISGFFASTAIYDAPYIVVVFNFIFAVIHSILLSDRFAKTETALYESTQKTEILAAKTAIYTQINHDIRTPLTVISNYAQIVMEQIAESSPDKQMVADLKVICDEAERLAVMVSRALRSSEVGGSPALLDIAGIARQMAVVFTRHIRLRERSFTADITESLLPVWGSYDDMIWLLWNLMSNAIDHNECGGITLSAALDGEIVIVTVMDEGEGIAPELLPRIFTRGMSGKGSTGLGLPRCREIARKYNGDVTVQSELGKGTVAAVTLPVYRAESEKFERQAVKP